MRSLIVIVLVISGLGQQETNGQTPRDESSPLIELGLTTNRSKTATGSGGFKARVLARSGLVVALYDCQADVEKLAQEWARKQGVRIAERKAEPERLRLVYNSSAPAGVFVLDYQVLPSRQAISDVRVSFVFRTLTNVALSGEDVGLERLGQDLLKATQCVP